MKVVRTIVAAASAALLAQGAWAGLGDVQGRLKHVRCKKNAAQCVVEIAVKGAGPSGNNCGVQVANLVLVRPQTATVKWTVLTAGYEFAPAAGVHRGIDIGDNDEDEDTPSSNPRAAFTVFSSSAKDVVMTVSNRTRHDLYKTFLYRVVVRKADGTACDAYDPMIVTRGD